MSLLRFENESRQSQCERERLAYHASVVLLPRRLGIHSFYTGKTTIGVIQLITLGGCGIWALIDFIMIICGNYRDGEGKIVTNNR